MLARFRDAIKKGIDPLHIIFGVETENFGIFGWNIGTLVVLFIHFSE
jgi:hypothetical protein